MWLSHITSFASELHELKNTDKSWRLEGSSSSVSDTIPTDGHTHTQLGQDRKVTIQKVSISATVLYIC
jgi:hypothetical protein